MEVAILMTVLCATRVHACVLRVEKVWAKERMRKAPLLAEVTDSGLGMACIERGFTYLFEFLLGHRFIVLC